MSGITINGGITVSMQASSTPRTAITTVANPASGGVTVSTAQFVFGNASMLCNNNGGLDCTNTGALTFGTGDLTMEFRMRTIAKSVGFPCMLCNSRQTTYTTNAWSFGDRWDDNPTKLAFAPFNFSGTARLLVSTSTINNNTWYAVAVTRQGSTWRMFINGNLEATNTWAGSLDGGSNNLITVGRADAGTTTYNGYIDELRISNIARYTANYTPATQPFTNDANTRMLLHCDGINGSTSFPDDNTVLSVGGITLSL